jgi:2-dehydropantoate 2-reductase
MRIIVVGVGAVGGAIAAALEGKGIEVIGIARGRQLEAIKAGGLRLRSPVYDRVSRFECVSNPAEIAFQDDDMILLCVKTQDSEAALDQLRAAGVRKQPIFCVQNGVANERIALRRFANVHGVTVMLPASFTKPGEVAASCAPKFGVFDIGRYPHGRDADDARLVEAFDGSMIAGFENDDVMASKYSKLLFNLGNILQAAVGPDADTKPISERLRSEAKTVFAAAGIRLAWGDAGDTDPARADLMRSGELPEDITLVGGSTAQSLARGAGSVETDYMNGEVSLLGRLHGVPTPLNDAMTDLGARLVNDNATPGAMTLDDLHRLLPDA